MEQAVWRGTRRWPTYTMNQHTPQRLHEDNARDRVTHTRTTDPIEEQDNEKQSSISIIINDLPMWAIDVIRHKLQDPNNELNLKIIDILRETGIDELKLQQIKLDTIDVKILKKDIIK